MDQQRQGKAQEGKSAQASRGQEGFDLPEAVTKGIAVKVQRPGGLLMIAVAQDKGMERIDQLGIVPGIVVHKRGKQKPRGTMRPFGGAVPQQRDEELHVLERMGPPVQAEKAEDSRAVN